VTSSSAEQIQGQVGATQVAERAWHDEHVLLKVYATCVDGREEAARRRIEAAVKVSDNPAAG
jgi:hypothetical protein